MEDPGHDAGAASHDEPLVGISLGRRAVLILRGSEDFVSDSLDFD